MADEQVNVVVEVDGRQLSELNISLKQTEENSEKASGKIKDMFETIKNSKAASVAFDFLKDSVGKAIERIDAIDTARKSLTNLGVDAGAAERLMNNLTRAVEGTPVALDQVTAGTKKLVAAGMEGERVEQVFKAISDAAFGVGDGGTSIDPMISAFEKMQSSAQLSLEPVKALEAQGVPALQILANQAGISSEEMEKRISAGAVDSKAAIDMLAKGIEDGTEGINGSTLKMAGLAEEAGSTLGGSFESMKQAVVDTIGTGLEPFRDVAVDALQTVTQKIREFRDMVVGSESINEFLTNLAEILGSLGSGAFDLLIAAFQGLAEMVGPILQFLADRLLEVTTLLAEGILTYVIPALESFMYWLGENEAVIQTVAAAVIGAVLAFQTFQTVKAVIEGVTTAINAVKTGIAGLGVLIAGNPIGVLVIVIGAIVGALIYLYQTNETVREFLNTAWESIKLAFAGVWEFIQANVLPIVQEIFDFLVGIWESWAAWWAENSEAIKLACQNAWNGIKDAITIVMEILAPYLTGVWNIIRDTIQAVMDFLAPFLIGTWENIQTVLSAVWGHIQVIIEQGTRFIQNLIMLVINAINQDWDAFWENIKNILGAAWEIIVSTITSVLDTFVSIFLNNWDILFNAAVSIWNGIKDVIIGVFGPIIEGVMQWISSVGSAISEGWNGIIHSATQIWNSLKSIICDSIGGALKGALDAVFNWGKTFYNAGKGLIGMIADGIRAGISIVTDAIGNVVGKVRDFLPFSPAKTGPLSDLDKLNFGGTISTGIYGGISDVKKAMNKMTASLDISPEMALGIQGAGGLINGISQVKNLSTIKTVNNSPSIVIEKVVWEGKEDIRRTSEELTWMSQHEERGLRG